jgi:membrane-associated phospholipid phosphatase
VNEREEIQHAANLLAAHAVLLLGLGLVAAVGALATVLAAVHLLRRYRSILQDGFSAALRSARRFQLLDRWLTHSAFVPSGYLALHLVLGLALTSAVVAFVVIAENVIGGGEIVAFDLAFAEALRQSATPEWQWIFAAVSWLGEREAIAVATAIVAFRLALAHSALIAVGWIAAQAGGGVLNLVLKQTFERTRPAFADPLLATSSWSFPSGHAMGTFILFGLGCYVLLRQARSWTVVALVVTLSLAWCIVMAFSRLYLGVHFVSDVAAGLVAGVAWVAVCASALEVVRRRHAQGERETRAANRAVRGR